jgi:hypothetical protein
MARKELHSVAKGRWQMSNFSDNHHPPCGPGSVIWLRAGRSGDRISVGARFSAPVLTDPGAHTASCTMGTGSFPGVKNGRGVTLAPHPLLVPWSWKGRAIPLLPLGAVRPVQSLSAGTGVHFIFFYFCHPPCSISTDANLADIHFHRVLATFLMFLLCMILFLHFI